MGEVKVTLTLAVVLGMALVYGVMADSSSEDAEKKMDSKYTLVAMDTDHDVSVQSGFSAYKTPFFQWLPPQSHDRLRRSARRGRRCNRRIRCNVNPCARKNCPRGTICVKGCRCNAVCRRSQHTFPRMRVTRPKQ